MLSTAVSGETEIRRLGMDSAHNIRANTRGANLNFDTRTPKLLQAGVLLLGAHVIQSLPRIRLSASTCWALPDGAKQIPAMTSMASKLEATFVVRVHNYSKQVSSGARPCVTQTGRSLGNTFRKNGLSLLFGPACRRLGPRK